MTQKAIPVQLIFLFISFLFALNATAQLPRYYQQTEKNNDGNILTVNILFGGHLSAADLSDRFGSHMSTGLGVDFISKKDWIFGAQGNFYFGSKVKEDIVSNLRNSDGLIFGGNNEIASLQLRQRGIYAGGHIGKIFRINSAKRSGVRATFGAGLYQHKVRIQDDPVVAVPQLNKTYKQGYDRLSNGISLTQFIGYQHLGAMRRANFIIGIELTEGFTQNRRNFNFDARAEENDSRFDMVVGIRAQWLLPFYLGESAEEIRY